MDFHALQSTLSGVRTSSTLSKALTFDQHYELLEEIGKGGYGTVWKCCRRHDALKRPYGVKIINKPQAGARGLKEVMGEVETMSLLSHPNIVRLEETFQDDEHLWIVMEYMPGGELQRALRRDGYFSESQARRITTQLLLALEFIHQKGIVHRDLKPENCLLSEGDLVCKISDFGFAVLVGSDQCLMSFCGTTVFMAPEIFSDTSYGKPVDMWALGVIVYLMITGEYPFTGRTSKEVTEAICEARYDLRTEKLSEASSALRDFIPKLLEIDPNRRYSAREALKHPWIKAGLNMNNLGVEQQEQKKRGMRPRSIFRSAVISIMAAHRLRYLHRCRVLEKNGCGGCSVLRNFRYAVSGVYEPPRPALDCGGMFVRSPRGVSFLLPMVEVSRTLESLDLSGNNIDSLSVFQQLMKAVAQHPSLLSLNLSGNPIPALAGRGLLRLSRNPQSKLQHLALDGTLISAETMAQIAAALKEKAANAPAAVFTPQLGTPPHITSPTTTTTTATTLTTPTTTNPTVNTTNARHLENATPAQLKSIRTHGASQRFVVQSPLSRLRGTQGPVRRLPPINSTKQRSEK
ncbi:Protein kinase domain [Trypanosoma melophagium]|uniref:Protein kinase domain n=1 Tax=Trypanosoma melophagium TaxID=715481 RepID=UPI00351A16EB|nr:Protein kinase domain [Trypanosoma melophagium]